MRTSIYGVRLPQSLSILGLVKGYCWGYMKITTNTKTLVVLLLGAAAFADVATDCKQCGSACDCAADTAASITCCCGACDTDTCSICEWPPSKNTCWDYNTDLNGYDLTAGNGEAGTTAGACQDTCVRTTNCEFWVFNSQGVGTLHNKLFTSSNSTCSHESLPQRRAPPALRDVF
jgi:hypothetical protein